MGGTPVTREAPEADIDQPRAAYEDLVREEEALRAENDRFRELLGLDDRPRDGHAQAWAPTLLTEPTERPAVDGSSTAGDRLALFRSLFGARSDVYAERWESASSGKAGWSPATKDRWSKGRPPKDHLPLTEEVFTAHLRGDQTIGIYPLLSDDTCALLACDFDKGTWALDALAYLDACHRNAVPAALERSRSGNGAHVWTFFDGQVAASSARAMGAALLRPAMTARAELDLSSYDRFFPSQDFMPKAGFGNLIALPLQGGCATSGTTLFLDPTTMEPWADQWAFLSSVARMTPDAVESLRPVHTGPALSLADLVSPRGNRSTSSSTPTDQPPSPCSVYRSSPWSAIHTRPSTETRSSWSRHTRSDPRHRDRAMSDIGVAGASVDVAAPFSVPMHARWADVDQNGHMRTVAYLEWAEDSRMHFFASAGFAMSEFQCFGVGPAIRSDELTYRVLRSLS